MARGKAVRRQFLKDYYFLNFILYINLSFSVFFFLLSSGIYATPLSFEICVATSTIIKYFNFIFII